MSRFWALLRGSKPQAGSTQVKGVVFERSYAHSNHVVTALLKGKASGFTLGVKMYQVANGEDRVCLWGMLPNASAREEPTSNADLIVYDGSLREFFATAYKAQTEDTNDPS